MIAWIQFNIERKTCGSLFTRIVKMDESLKCLCNRNTWNSFNLFLLSAEKYLNIFLAKRCNLDLFEIAGNIL